MPANVVTFDKMQVGHKGKGKHWTKAEVERRKAAAQLVSRQKPRAPKPPAWIKRGKVVNDPEVYAIWQKVVRDAKELDLLDTLDANTLATYCKLEVEKERAIQAGNVALFDRLAKTSLSYAKALGLTPEARARLAKKRADEEVDPNADLFE